MEPEDRMSQDKTLDKLPGDAPYVENMVGMRETAHGALRERARRFRLIADRLDALADSLPAKLSEDADTALRQLVQVAPGIWT